MKICFNQPRFKFGSVAADENQSGDKNGNSPPVGFANDGKGKDEAAVAPVLLEDPDGDEGVCESSDGRK